MSYFRGGMGDDPSDKPTAQQSAADLAMTCPGGAQGRWEQTSSGGWLWTCPAQSAIPFLGPLFDGIANTLKSIGGAGAEAGSAAANAQAAATSQSNAMPLILGGLAIAGVLFLFSKATPKVAR